MYSKSRVRTTTGDFVAQGTSTNLFSISIAAGADVATAIFRTGGAAGTVVGALSAAIGATASHSFTGLNQCHDGLHVTITGTTPNVIAEFSA